MFADPEVTPPTVRSTKSTKPSSSMLYGHDKDLPILETGKKERYTVREVAKRLLMEQGEKCRKIPLRVRRNLSFLVDVSKYKCWQDVKSDMNGVYSETLRIATWTVEVDRNDQVQVLEKKKVELASDNEYHIYVHSTKNKAGLCRSIFLFF